MMASELVKGFTIPAPVAVTKDDTVLLLGALLSSWDVSSTIVTEKGNCDRGYRYPVRISNGTLANAGDSVFTISGRVGGSGAITVTLSAGGRSATGSGRLAGNMGGGSWSGGACSGSWTAERRGS